jgi:CheY-like chemotaxis protein
VRSQWRRDETPRGDQGAFFMTAEERPSVLVVDDHQGFRSLARRMLETGGFSVTEAPDGASAIELARLLHPQLVLLDVQLPDASGFSVARLLAVGEGSPIVVLTSSREISDYGDQVSSSPAAGFVAKHELSSRLLHSFLSARR